MVGAGQQYPGELPVRAGRRLQRDRIHAGDIEQAGLQQANDLERPLGERFGLVRMGLRDALEAGDELVHPRVVFHGAAAQRIHAEIDGIVPGGETGEVANDLDLAQFGHQSQIRAGRLAQQVYRIDVRHIEGRHFVGLLTRRRLFKYQGLILSKVRTHLAACAFKGAGGCHKG
jgi:hypothetical protein